MIIYITLKLLNIMKYGFNPPTRTASYQSMKKLNDHAETTKVER